MKWLTSFLVFCRMIKQNKILLVDDHTIIRTGLKVYIKTHLQFHDIEEANSCANAMKLLHGNNFTHLILDIILSDGSSLEIMPNIIALYPALRILVYSMQPEKIYSRVLKKYNINHYIEKSLDEAGFSQKLNTFFNNYEYIPKQKQTDTDSPFSKLSPREMEILFYILRGQSTKEIADTLNLKMTSVSTMKKIIFNKTSTSTLKDLLDLATLYNVNY